MASTELSTSFACPETLVQLIAAKRVAATFVLELREELRDYFSRYIWPHGRVIHHRPFEWQAFKKKEAPKVLSIHVQRNAANLICELFESYGVMSVPSFAAVV